MALSGTFGLIPLLKYPKNSLGTATGQSTQQTCHLLSRKYINSLPTDFYKKYVYTILYHICGNKMVQVVEIHPQEMREPDFLHGQ